MTEKECEDAKQIWRMMYARESFQSARAAAEHLRIITSGIDDPIYYPLLAGMCVTYARPFTKCHGIQRLDPAMIPAEHEGLHNHLMSLRDKCYAHLDANRIDGISNEGMATRVFLRRDRQGDPFVCNILYTRSIAMDEIVTLCDRLIEKCRHHLEKLRKRYRKQFPENNGWYVVEISDKSPQMFRQAQASEIPPAQKLRNIKDR